MRTLFLPLWLSLMLAIGTAPVLAESGQCDLCGKNMSESSNTFMILENGEHQTYGCPGCGLAVLSALPQGHDYEPKAQDFLRRTWIDAKDAWYLRGTEIGFCCQPNWLAFSSKEEAEKFARGFGGEVLDFDAALKAAPEDHGHMHHH